MTNKEVIKVLNTATNIDGLQICCIDYENAPETKAFLSIKSDIVDLINRQQEEKKTMQAHIDCLNAEIERLQQETKHTNDLRLEIFENKSAWERLARAEAIKEVAERLKDKASFIGLDGREKLDLVDTKTIDNLVKEMVGDDK